MLMFVDLMKTDDVKTSQWCSFVVDSNVEILNAATTDMRQLFKQLLEFVVVERMMLLARIILRLNTECQALATVIRR